MPLFRLLRSTLAVAALAATLSAQSSPDKIAAANASSSSDNSDAQLNRALRSALEDELADAHSCLKMRMYKVRRDNPDSDATHLVSYSTCLPVARIQTYTIERDQTRTNQDDPLPGYRNGEEMTP
jgi:hypothetical protein